MCGRLQDLKQTCEIGDWRVLSCRQTLDDLCVGKGDTIYSWKLVRRVG